MSPNLFPPQGRVNVRRWYGVKKKELAEVRGVGGGGGGGRGNRRTSKGGMPATSLRLLGDG